MHVAVTPDRAYLPACGAMLHSLLVHNAAHTRVTVHVVPDASLSEADLAALGRLVRDNGGDFAVHAPPAPGLQQHFVAHWRFPAVASYRLLFGSLLPGLEKVLYLDSDTLVLGDLRPLWDIDLAGRALAGATHPLFPHFSRQRVLALGVRRLEEFFNSGVLLMNLASLRRYEARFLAFLDDPARRAQLEFPDQDVLNAVIPASDRLLLHPRWNLQIPHLELPLRWIPGDRAQVLEARRNPAIVHFNGMIKPWHFRSRHPYRAQFREHLAQTPWRDLPEPDRTFKNAVLRWLPGWVVPLARSRLGL